MLASMNHTPPAPDTGTKRTFQAIPLNPKTLNPKPEGNWLADMQGWLPEMQNGCPRCKTISLLACVQPTCQTAGRHAGVAARDAKQNHVLPRTTTYDHVLPRTTTYYHVLSRTTTSVVFASRAATLACRPASSRSLLLNCYLLIYCRTSTY